jgi:hypothetical protein
MTINRNFPTPHVASRGLSAEFLSGLLGGFLSPLLDRVKADGSLCLELRDDYISIYYRGGSLLKVSRSNGAYLGEFNSRYFKGTTQMFQMPASPLRGGADVAAWLAVFPWLKQGMDLFFGKDNGEREMQQHLLLDNNIGTIAQDTDYYVCDIEYANKHGRFDAVAVGWPSTPAIRKKPKDRRLVLAELKFGDGSLGGTSGLHAHIDHVNAYLSDPANVDRLKAEMLTVFNQKRALGLISCKRDLLGFSDELPLLLLVLANHDPAKSNLRKLLRSLPASPHAEVRIATGSFLGYGLYDPAILPVEGFLERFESCI